MMKLFLILFLFSFHLWALNPLQWGLQNQGASQFVDLDTTRYFRQSARPGVDVQLPASVKAKKKVIVAVLDTGIDKTHPALIPYFHRNPKECVQLERYKSCLASEKADVCDKNFLDPKNPDYDSDKNGYPLDCLGWSVLNAGGANGIKTAGILGQPEFADPSGHGTHVAGIVAHASSELGTRGIGENVEILPVQVLGEGPNQPLKPQSVQAGQDFNPIEANLPPPSSLGDFVARGIMYAVRSGAQVINFSVGWPQNADSEYLRKVVKAAQDRGVIIVAAAGNDSTNALLRPCSYPGVICVGAHGPDGALAGFSNFGGSVDIAAPGLQILSTFPMDGSMRAVRFNDTKGFEYYSGTSQASPFVAGAIGEMLARGIPANEIYARLIGSAKPVLDPLALKEGMPHELERLVNIENKKDDKYLLSGLLNLKGALDEKPRPLLVPVSKEKQVITWDRKSPVLKLQFEMQNRWQALPLGQLRMGLTGTKLWQNKTLRTQSFNCHFGALTVWAQNQIFPCEAVIEIIDSQDPSKSQMPSVLEFEIQVDHPGAQKIRRLVEAEILIPLTKEFQDPDVDVVPVNFTLPRASRLIPIDEYLDGERGGRDYLVVEKQTDQWTLGVSRQKQNGYGLSALKKIEVAGAPNEWRDQILTRLSVSKDGKAQYVLGLYSVKEPEEGERLKSIVDFYFFDEDLKEIRPFRYESPTTFMPFQISWHRVGSSLLPAWVGPGVLPVEKKSARDLWENPPDPEDPFKGEKIEIRFYYLDEQAKLKTVPEEQGYKIVDILQATVDQTREGIVPVLLAKNRGTEVKPSYLYDFAVAEVYNGKLRGFQPINLFKKGVVYRNILDSRVDRVLNLNLGTNEWAGTFWDGDIVRGALRLTWIENQQGRQSSTDLFASELGSDRYPFDSALRVRSVYAGDRRRAAFVMTNSEIQYHDLLTNKVLKHSLERYTFIGEMATTNLQFPLVVRDSKNNQAHLPALFTTEGSGLSRGVRVLTPVYVNRGGDMNTEPVALISPARLRFWADREKGCRPLETPVFIGRNKASAFDYYCGDRILRVNLSF